MALEEFMIDLCEESVNGALLVGCAKRYTTRRKALIDIWLGLLALSNLPSGSIPYTHFERL